MRLVFHDTVPARVVSTLRFGQKTARFRKVCTVSCGQSHATFEIIGILQWVCSIHGSTMKIILGESNMFDEFVLSDFGHIFDVILNWSKLVIAACLLLILALVIGFVVLELWTQHCPAGTANPAQNHQRIHAHHYIDYTDGMDECADSSPENERICETSLRRILCMQCSSVA